MFAHLGKVLIIFGSLVVVSGLILLFVDKLPFLGKLPGDISFRSGSTKFYIPLATCLVLSVVLTIILNLLGRWK